MKGLHITADLYRCEPTISDVFTHVRYLAGLTTIITRTAGLSVLKDAWHQFPSSDDQPGGITGMVLLAESHIAVHTWPELKAVTLDVYVCNYTCDNSAKAETVVRELLQHFKPLEVEINRITRGEFSS
jgi:spermidine synthase